MRMTLKSWEKKNRPSNIEAAYCKLLSHAASAKSSLQTTAEPCPYGRRCSGLWMSWCVCRPSWLSTRYSRLAWAYRLASIRTRSAARNHWQQSRQSVTVTAPAALQINFIISRRSLASAAMSPQRAPFPLPLQIPSPPRSATVVNRFWNKQSRMHPNRPT